ncbi:hypothetical protein POTOM_006858 [Populus tomentosa]|uniref:Zinc finger LSD1-type domain-containing protein n=1 Tax=Populus tomentosa TaxID=118781 RepID=A0A8X8ANY0_POPTO|nr:hypothetical protein POTOM_006858 [Populus tomentosa]
MQSQVVCRGCTSVLLYPSGATNVCCALCSSVTSITSPGDGCFEELLIEKVIANVSTWGNNCEMLLLPCSERCTRLTYLVCIITTDSLAWFFFLWYKGVGYNQAAHVNCGNCRTALMYPNGSPSVKCPVCHYVTNVSMANMRIPLPANRPNGIGGTAPSTSMVSNWTFFSFLVAMPQILVILYMVLSKSAVFALLPVAIAPFSDSNCRCGKPHVC